MQEQSYDSLRTFSVEYDAQPKAEGSVLMRMGNTSCIMCRICRSQGTFTACWERAGVDDCRIWHASARYPYSRST